MDAFFVHGIIFDSSEGLLHGCGGSELVRLVFRVFRVFPVLDFLAAVGIQASQEDTIIEESFTMPHLHLEIVLHLSFGKSEQVFALYLVLVEMLLAIPEFYEI